MLKMVMDVAAEQFAFAPLLIILLLAAVALVTVVFLLRYRRKGDTVSSLGVLLVLIPLDILPPSAAPAVLGPRCTRPGARLRRLHRRRVLRPRDVDLGHGSARLEAEAREAGLAGPGPVATRP